MSELNPGVMAPEELDAKLAEMKKQGIKELDYKMSEEIFKTTMDQMGFLFSFILHNNPNAKNYIAVDFNSDNPDLDFKVIFLKKGGKLPPWAVE